MFFLSENANGENVQRFATTIGNLLCLSFGLMFGISPGHSDLYLSTATPLNKTIDAESASWLSALLFLSAIAGALFFGWLSSKIGPKSVLYISGILQIKGWFCIHFAYDIVHVYSSRIFAGVAGGAAFAVLPVYIAEISEPAHYASLLGSVDQWRTAGIFLGILMATYLPYPLVPILGLGLSIAFCLICPFIQETPYYFMKKRNEQSMEKSLRWFRGIRKVEDQQKREFVMELHEFKSEMEGKTRIGDFQMSRWYRMKLFTGCVVLAVGAQLSGVYVILNDGGHVFGSTYTSTKLSTELCLLALALSQVLGTTVSRMIGVNLKRKVLLIVTTVVSGLSLLCFVLLRTYCSSASVIEQQNSLAYLGLLALYMMSTNVGLYPLSLIILSEMTPAKLRSQITAWTSAISNLSVFFLLKYFNEINLLLAGPIGWFWLFTIVSFTIAVLAFFLLPETSDKSSYEVQEVMGYSSNDNIPKINTITNGRINNGANV